MNINWRERALDDIEIIRDYIARDNQFYATIFVAKIIESVEKLMEFPRLGRVVPEYQNDSIREIIYRDYRVIYEIYDEEIYILTVLHGSKLLDWCQDLGISIGLFLQAILVYFISKDV